MTANNKYTIDGKTPNKILKPTIVSDIQDCVKQVETTGNSVIPVGGGTKLSTGSIPKSYGTAIDLCGMNKIIEYEPADLVMHVEPGVTLDQINEAATKEKQFFALNPSDSASATIAGVLSANSSGYLRESYGTARDMTLGMKFIRGNGIEVKGGGKVTKNVAGYDLVKLMIGSHGNLGIISELTLRLHPLPEISDTVGYIFDSMENACKFVSRNNYSSHKPNFSVILIGNKMLFDLGLGLGLGLGQDSKNVNINDVQTSQSKVVVIAGFDGIQDIVTWQKQKFAEIFTSLSQNDIIEFGENSSLIRNKLQNLNSHNRSDIVLKTSLNFSQIGKVNNWLSENFISSDENVSRMILPYSGIMYTMFSSLEIHRNADEISSVLTKYRKFTESEKCHVVMEKVPTDIKQNVKVYGNFNGIEIMQRIKHNFDPNGVFSPGRMIS